VNCALSCLETSVIEGWHCAELCLQHTKKIINLLSVIKVQSVKMHCVLFKIVPCCSGLRSQIFTRNCKKTVVIIIITYKYSCQINVIINVLMR